MRDLLWLCTCYGYSPAIVAGVRMYIKMCVYALIKHVVEGFDFFLFLGILFYLNRPWPVPILVIYYTAV